jgi:nicotinate dehydrogenase subunit A
LPSTLTINGVAHDVSATAETPLLYVLRNDLGLKGTRFGCGTGSCGACFVLIDGEPTSTCDLPISAVQGRSVTTIEGLSQDGAPDPLQQAFIDEQAGQCGYCLSGILISAKALLERNPHPTTVDIRAALAGNLCRCGAHARIIRAVHRAATATAGHGR